MKAESKSNREHSFDVELASIVGLEKSILLKNIDHWVLENERRNQKQYFSNGIWWTEESLSSLVRKYPYMKKASISRWMQELHTDGWITVVVSKSGVNRYTVGLVFKTWNEGGCWLSELPLYQNETAKRYPKMRRQLSQNETEAIPEWDGIYPKMGHTNIESNVDSNIDLNGKAGKPPKPEKKEKPIIHRMVEVFESEHKKHFQDGAGQWIGFTWQNKEFGALKSLSVEFEKRLKGRGADFSESSVLIGWENFLKMAADSDRFTVQNWFTPTKLWSNFQTIIQKIQQCNGKQSSSNNAGQFKYLDKAQQQHARMARFVADIHSGAAFADTGAVDIITGE